MTARPLFRLLLLAAMLLAPLGRIGIAQAMAMPASAPAAMAGHCADMPAAAPAHHQNGSQKDHEQMAVDCMVACAALAPAPAPFIAPAPLAATLPGALLLSSLTGILPEAELPPPRFS